MIVTMGAMIERVDTADAGAAEAPGRAGESESEGEVVIVGFLTA
jgi:hypothetical protein